MIENAPMIDGQSLPDNEQVAAHFIQRNLYELAYSVREFASTLELFLSALTQDRGLRAAEKGMIANRDWAALQTQLEGVRYQRDRCSDWMTIAGRNGAIVAYGFWMKTQAIYDLLGKCPTLRGKHDGEMMKSSRKTFEAAFPGIASIRKAAAHPGELSAKPEEIAKHYATSGLEEMGIMGADGGSVYLSGHMMIDDKGMTYAATFMGKVVKYRLSAESLAELGKTVDLIWEAFWPTAHAFRRNQRERSRTAEPPAQG